MMLPSGGNQCHILDQDPRLGVFGQSSAKFYAEQRLFYQGSFIAARRFLSRLALEGERFVISRPDQRQRLCSRNTCFQ